MLLNTREYSDSWHLVGGAVPDGHSVVLYVKLSQSYIMLRIY